MSLMTFKEVQKLEETCLKLYKIQGIHFAGIINSKGKLIAGGFCSKKIPYEKEKLSMIFLELYLDYSMRRDFDSVLGKIGYMTTRREQTNVTTIPFNEDLILIFSDPEVNAEDLVMISKNFFKNFFKNEVDACQNSKK